MNNDISERAVFFIHNGHISQDDNVRARARPALLHGEG
jgi:hypothetical protein